MYMRIIEYLFPKSLDEKNIEECTEETFSKKCTPKKLRSIVTLSSFSDTQIRSALHLNKFHNNTHAQTLLSSLLQTYLVTLIEQEYLIIPIPLSRKRERERGYNQVTEIIAKIHCNTPVYRVERNILVRTIHTPPQTSLTKKDRLKNLSGAFALQSSQAHKISNAHILLIDDVVTTGSTLLHAQSVLIPHNPRSITCIALAH